MDRRLPNTDERVRTATVLAAAKVNLTLRVLGRRPDGYHDLRSLVIGVDLCDRVRCTPSSEPGIQVGCDDPSLRGRDNLAWKSAEHLAAKVSMSPSLRFHIEKRIPIGAGLGGGSSDAASTLRLCNHVWNAGFDEPSLAEIGADIGSDVPLFFQLPSVVMAGRGERVQFMPIRWSGWILLIFVGIPVPTAEAYGRFNSEDAGEHPEDSESRIAAATEADEIQSLAFNDLEPTVFRVAPAVEIMKRRLDELGLGPIRVSGAGSTLYRLFDDADAARRSAARLRERGIGSRVEVVKAPVGVFPITMEES